MSYGTWLAASAQSAVGIASVHFEVSGGSVSDLVVSSSADTDWGWIGAWDSTDVSNGVYTVQSVATDQDGVSTTSAGLVSPLSTSRCTPGPGAGEWKHAEWVRRSLGALAGGTSDVTGVSSS